MVSRKKCTNWSSIALHWPQVKCSYSSCKQEPTRIVITDSCPGLLQLPSPANQFCFVLQNHHLNLKNCIWFSLAGGTYCSTGEPAFDLSGMAMTNMALPGRDQELRNLGLYDIQYKRVPCYYPNRNIAFKVDPGSTPYWMSFTVEYQGGPGDIDSVEVRQVLKQSPHPNSAMALFFCPLTKNYVGFSTKETIFTYRNWVSLCIRLKPPKILWDAAPC